VGSAVIVSTAEPPTTFQQPRVMLVCSPGGHLLQMFALRSAWEHLPHAWVTLPAADTSSLLARESVIYGHGPTNRSLSNLVRNIRLAAGVLIRRRPDVMLSTGGGITVPFFVLGRLLGVRLVYVESLTRITGLSLTGRLVHPFCDYTFVQWPTAVSDASTLYVGGLL